MNRQQKINKLKNSKVPITVDGKPFIEAFQKTVNHLIEILGLGVDLNADDAIKELRKVGVLSEEISKLDETIGKLEIPEYPKELRVEKIDGLIEALNEVRDKEFDFETITPITDAVLNLANKIEEIQVPEQGQRAEDYKPVRRVIKVGNRFYFDDNPTGTGGGGSSSSGGGGATTIADGADVALGSTTDAAVDTDATGTVSGKLRGLVKLFVNYLSRFPASLGQKTKAGSLPVTLASDEDTIDVLETNSASIKTAVEKIDDAISGSEMQVDVVGALPAGDNTVGRVKLTDGTEVAEVNARADGKNALEVADDMTSFEAFTQALSASTDTTITFSQTVRLIRVKNNSTSAVVYVRDGAISSDTPANAELVGVAAAANLPNTEYYPFVGTTIHLRSAGTPTVSVTGFY